MSRNHLSAETIADGIRRYMSRNRETLEQALSAYCYIVEYAEVDPAVVREIVERKASK